MQKSKTNKEKILGTVPKKLQLVETFWDCPEFSENTKNQKGITLIALVITIIVMLILVGVTINVALSGGLFTKARTATQDTEKQMIYEQIVSGMELTNMGNIDIKATFNNALKTFEQENITNQEPTTIDENTSEVTFSVIGKLGTYSYKISTTKIEILGKKEEIPELNVGIFTTQIINNANIRITGLVNPDGVISIAMPATLEYEGKTYNVTEIGDKAFAGVEIPDGYTAEDIANLTEDSEEFKQIASSQSKYFNINSIDFSNATNLEAIGEMSFAGLVNLNNITLPENLKTIGKGAFGISALTGKVELNSTLETIDNYAFWGSTGITEITYDGEHLITIGHDVFYKCTNLSKVTLNCNSLNTIGNSAFYGCTNLSGEFNVPSSVTEIGASAFRNTAISKLIINNNEGAISGAPWGLAEDKIEYTK